MAVDSSVMAAWYCCNTMAYVQITQCVSEGEEDVFGVYDSTDDYDSEAEVVTFAPTIIAYCGFETVATTVS